MLSINLIGPKNNLILELSFSMTGLGLAKIFALSNQPIRGKNSNFKLVSCIFQWPKLVSVLLFISVFFPFFFHILITTSHIILKIHQQPHFYNKLLMINKFHYNPTNLFASRQPV